MSLEALAAIPADVGFITVIHALEKVTVSAVFAPSERTETLTLPEAQLPSLLSYLSGAGFEVHEDFTRPPVVYAFKRPREWWISLIKAEDAAAVQ